MKGPELLQQRRCGILLHPTSFPGPYSNGDLGHQAYRFIEFLQASGCSLWQMLPLGPTHSDLSPYQAMSSHAGNPLLISLDWLVDRGWLDQKKITVPRETPGYRRECLQQAGENFKRIKDSDWQKRLQNFVEASEYWLEDFSIFCVLKKVFDHSGWFDWPEELRNHDEKAVQAFARKHRDMIRQIHFEQFVFYTQYEELKDYAHAHGVYLFGDLPIFVAYDSADVWSQRDNFLLDDTGQCEFVAGVPPDAFSDTGQRWGNPLYDWDYLQQSYFRWWLDRIKSQLSLYDLIRIDHFRGLEACWQIPACDDTAENGQWVKMPGRELLNQIIATFDQLPLVAEDLGVITPEVEALREEYALPGMKILQFAFGDDHRNPYLPHNHSIMSVVYTGTHDNNTSLGWYQAEPEAVRQHLADYLGKTPDMPWSLMRLCLASVANLAVVPLQDVLSLDGDHRMNIPGTPDGNWRWRFKDGMLTPALARRLLGMNRLYGRTES